MIESQTINKRGSMTVPIGSSTDQRSTVVPGRTSGVPEQPVCFLDLRARERARAAGGIDSIAGSAGEQLARLWPNGIPKNHGT